MTQEEMAQIAAMVVAQMKSAAPVATLPGVQPSAKTLGFPQPKVAPVPTVKIRGAKFQRCEDCETCTGHGAFELVFSAPAKHFIPGEVYQHWFGKDGVLNSAKMFYTSKGNCWYTKDKTAAGIATAREVVTQLLPVLSQYGIVHVS